MKFKGYKFGNEFMKTIPKRESKELPGKEQMPLPNIHLNKGKYLKSGEELNTNLINHKLCYNTQS